MQTVFQQHGETSLKQKSFSLGNFLDFGGNVSNCSSLHSKLLDLLQLVH